jgi:malonate-semialdehyde dehydrogenase (acetylating)/methylmalonate-semialdehyde dehydrogenase
MNKPIELQTLPHWIGGKPVASQSGRACEVTNPATGAVTKRVPFANAGEVDAAVKAAQAALPAWRDAPPLRRARVMQKFLALLQDDQKALAQLVTEEHG